MLPRTPLVEQQTRKENETFQIFHFMDQLTKNGIKVCAAVLEKSTHSFSNAAKCYNVPSSHLTILLHHSADQFERLLKEMCADEDGDLMIDSAVKNVPKVFVVSTLVSMMSAQPFIFRNYQYRARTPEVALATSDSSGIN